MSACVLCDRSVPHVCDFSDVGHEPEDIIAALRAEVERLRGEVEEVTERLKEALEDGVNAEEIHTRLVREKAELVWTHNDSARRANERAARAEAIARELAEAVVEAEWQGEGGFWEEAACPFCGTNQESYKNPAEHDEKCPVRKARAALARAREAGLL